MDKIKKSGIYRSMRLFLLLSFMIIFASVPQQAGAARFSGDYLSKVCAQGPQGEEFVAGGHIACQAYIAGILDYHNVIRAFGPVRGVDFCVPAQTDLYTVQNKVAKYLYNNHNEHAAFVAAPGVALALYSAYPCP